MHVRVSSFPGFLIFAMFQNSCNQRSLEYRYPILGGGGGRCFVEARRVPRLVPRLPPLEKSQAFAREGEAWEL